MPLTLGRVRTAFIAVLAMALAALSLAGPASAELTGDFVHFQQCPYENSEVKRCVISETDGGEVILGSKKVPIINTQTLQGGLTKPDEEGNRKLVAPKNKITLSDTSQPVPGGLAGLVPPESSPPLVKAAIAFFFENKLTGVDTTLELARPESEVTVNENHLGERIGVALRLPVKAHLENPFLGANCYVGSSTTPIIWELTSGFTEPPAPNEPIEGSAGELTLTEEGAVLRLDNALLVDNAWSAPAASGCGGALSLLVDPVINAASGLPAKAGTNTASLENTILQAPAFAVKTNDEEN